MPDDFATILNDLLDRLEKEARQAELSYTQYLDGNLPIEFLTQSRDKIITIKESIRSICNIDTANASRKAEV